MILYFVVLIGYFVPFLENEDIFIIFVDKLKLQLSFCPKHRYLYV